MQTPRRNTQETIRFNSVYKGFAPYINNKHTDEYNVIKDGEDVV